MRKSDCVVGLTIRTVMGIPKTGQIIKPFDWRQSTDGTYREMDPKMYVAVLWDDGTKGYACRYHITTNSVVEDVKR